MVATHARRPRLITAEPIGPVTHAIEPVAVVAMYRGAPPFTGPAEPRAVVAVAWTRAQVLVRRSWPETSTEAWLPAADVHRIRVLAKPRPVTARTAYSTGEVVAASGEVVAEATRRRTGVVAAVLVRFAPSPDSDPDPVPDQDAGAADAHAGVGESRERWLLVEDLVDEDPLDDVAS